jgi:dipeptidyl aminopeptidase/acylaminoacyl peptidase
VDVADIRAGLDHVIALGIADEHRIGAGGWSYGGILTDYLIAREPRIRAAISGAGSGNPLGMYGIDMYAREYTLELGPPWEQRDRWLRLAYPFFHPETIKAATLFECAGADDNVPCAGALQMYLALKTLNTPTELVVFPGENHDLSIPRHLVDRLRRNITWYDRWLVSKQ